jgi:fatty-acyl-CoA synthase
VRDTHSKNTVQEMIEIAFGEAVSVGVIPKWATPDRIDFVNEITKTSVGKIDKKALRIAIQKAGKHCKGK